ncbi:MAG: hypothetical protein GEU80_02315 [Dehalococcoidia bacterium]|nr:hypothetical protein [Dehalococcoidia bacterium]
MRADEREELLTAYALGTLSAPDAEDVEELLRTDPAASAELARYYEIVELIALSVPLRRADPSLRERVLAAVRRESTRRALTPVARARRWLPAAGIAAGVAIIAMWAVNLQQSLDDLRSDNQLLAAIVEADAKRLDALSDAGLVAETRSHTLETQLNDTGVLATIMLDPDVVTSPLEGTSSSHGAGGTYAWSANADAGVLRVHDLPPLPAGAFYRVWLEDRFSRLVAATDFEADFAGAATVVLRGTSDEDPVRVYVVATSSTDTEVVEGPVILQATAQRPTGDTSGDTSGDTDDAAN